MSIMTDPGVRLDERRSSLFFQTREGNYNSESLLSFLTDLHRELRGRKVVLVWDGLPAHKSRKMKEYLRQQRHWLREERLPGYAPDLNPWKRSGEISKGKSWPIAVRRIWPKRT